MNFNDLKINDDIKNWCIDGEKLESKPKEYDVKIKEKVINRNRI